jgi:hypothetical protein
MRGRKMRGQQYKRQQSNYKEWLKKLNISTYLSMITFIYIVLIIGIMPLYMKDGIYYLGDAKYEYYMKASIILTGLLVIGVIYSIKEGLKFKLGGAVEYFLIAFLIESGISFLLSDYKDTAWSGYTDWYMGLLTWTLIIIWTISIMKFYNGDNKVWYIIFISVTIVAGIGLLNRFEQDPLNVFINMDRDEWNRRNLISTIGNINWFSGYMSVVLPLLIYLFYIEKGYKHVIAGISAFIGLGVMMINGSDSSYASIIAMLVVLLFISSDASKLLRFIEVISLIPLFLLYISVVDVHLFIPDGALVPLYGNVGALISILIMLAAVYVGIRAYSKNINSKLYRVIKVIFIICALVGLVVIITCQISDKFWQSIGGYGILKFNDNWGSLRGGLWKETIRAYSKESWTEKLIGCGQDCFARLFYEKLGLDVIVEGIWSNCIYANAHNEWLTMLINQGIIGCGLYIGIFVSAFIEFKKSINKNNIAILGILAIVSYAANNFFSFSTIVSTPLIFIMIALCINQCRMN